jgi:hypothetical protein
MIEDTALVAKVVQGEIVFPVIMLDKPLHTEANGYRCTDHTCPCYKGMQERRERLPLNGNRPFSLLR